MKKISVISLFTLLLGVNSTLLAEDLINISAQQAQSLGISVLPIMAAQNVVSNQLPGEITIPVGQERVLSTTQGGLVDMLSVASGQAVKRGQILGYVNSNEILVLQRDYLRGKTQYQLNNNMLARDRELYKDGIIAERRLLTTESENKELAVEIQQRRLALKMAGMGDASIAQLEKHGPLVSGLPLIAPMDGVVIEQMAVVGQRVDAGTPIYRIAKLNPLWLEIHAPLDTINFAKEGMQVSIPKYQAKGKITTIIHKVSRDDQTIQMRAVITSGAEKLFPGQYVVAELISESNSHQFTVPKASLVRHGNESFVFVQTPKGFLAKPVIAISEQSDIAIIQGKFSGNEKVAATGTAAIKAAWFNSKAQ